jgi:hypothetical protein
MAALDACIAPSALKFLFAVELLEIADNSISPEMKNQTERELKISFQTKVGMDGEVKWKASSDKK